MNIMLARIVRDVWSARRVVRDLVAGEPTCEATLSAIMCCVRIVPRNLRQYYADLAMLHFLEAGKL